MSIRMQNVLFLILISFPGIASGSEQWQVQSPFSSTHNINIPNNVNSITVEWTTPSGLTPSATEGYYVSFSSPSPYTFTEDDSESVTRGVGEILKLNKSSLSTTSQDVIGSTISGTGLEAYYFNIAVLDDMEVPYTPGVTTHLGPYFIDTEAPKFPTVSAPSTTSTSDNIPLTLGVSGASTMCISESGYGNCGVSGWKDYTTTWLWSVSEGEGTKNIYVQFKDAVGNSSNASTTILYQSEDDDQEQGLTSIVGIPTLNEWGVILFMMILLIIVVINNKSSKTFEAKSSVDN